MAFRIPCAARAAALFIVALGLLDQAAAVDAVGPPIRVDQDPGGTPIYFFQNFTVARTDAGGFAVTWDENTKFDNPIVHERLRFRVYKKSFKPVAAPQVANQAGRDDPRVIDIVPLGVDKAYLVYAVRRETSSLDHPEVREAYGQAIGLATGKALGARRLLNTTGDWDSLTGLATGLADSRAVVAWFESDESEPAPGRLISSAGLPQAADLDFACCDGAQLTGLFPLGTGFVASYIRNSIFGGANGLYARVFKANGQPAAAAKRITPSVKSPFIRALANGRIALFTFVPESSPTRLVVQLYRSNWVKIGGPKTLISNIATTKFVDFEPTLDGGVLMIRTVQNGSTYRRTVRRLNANFGPKGPDYTFASPHGFDFFRIATVGNTRAVVLFRNLDDIRNELIAQILSH